MTHDRDESDPSFDLPARYGAGKTPATIALMQLAFRSQSESEMEALIHNSLSHTGPGNQTQERLQSFFGTI